ncbi:MAG: hypothetical protein KAJ07_00480 [Planctomycetes bacterium]|nr:hypothetical protein [Planctomycetota bacterium]
MKKIFNGVLAVILATCLLGGIGNAADERIQSSERMVGAGHSTLSDTLNRLSLIEHNNDGTHDLLTQVTDPWIDVRAYGAIANDGLDDSTAVQAAIDAAKGTSETDPSLTVFFPSGTYNLATAITWHDSNIIGQQANSGVRIYWDGAAGATVFTKPVATWGGSSHGIMEGINFRGGTNEPATWIDLTANIIDKNFKLSRVHFGDSGAVGLGCTGDAIKIGRWVNVHWEDLRFDSVGGYAIRATPTSIQHLSSFILDKFTYDQNRSSGPASGMIMVDNSDDATNLGTFEISNGRIEINTAWTGNQAIVTLKILNVPTATNSLGLVLRNVTYQDSASMANDNILYRETTNTTGRESLILDNFRGSGISTMLGGTWPSNQYLPSVGNVAYVAMNTLLDGVLEIGAQGRDAFIFHRSTLSTDNSLAVGVSTDADNRLEILSTGQISWGNGTDAVDTNLYRNGVGQLKTDGSIVKAIGTLADSATPSISAGGDLWLTGGTTTVTDISGGAEGQTITILSEHAITITDGTNFFLSGSANFVMASTDSLVIVQKADGNWYEVSRSVN